METPHNAVQAGQFLEHEQPPSPNSPLRPYSRQHTQVIFHLTHCAAASIVHLHVSLTSGLRALHIQAIRNTSCSNGTKPLQDTIFDIVTACGALGSTTHFVHAPTMDYYGVPPPHLRSPVDDGTRLGMIREESNRMAMFQQPMYQQPRQEASPMSDTASSEQSQDSNQPNKRARHGYECVECGTTYTEKRALARHRHTDMHRRRLGLQPDKRHLCVKCGRSFGRNHDLQRHRREQHGEATGATTVDVSGNRSDDNHENYASLSTKASWSGPMSTGIAPDEMMLQPPNLRGAKSYGDFSSTRTGSTPSLTKSSSGESVPSIKTENNSDWSIPVQTWPGDDDQRIFTPTPPRQLKQPERRHSSDGLRDELVPRRKDSSQPSRPSTATTRGERDARTGPSGARILAHMIVDEPDVEGYQPPICLPCGRVFGDDDQLLDHLKTHLESFKGNHKCKKCQIGFDHEEDLQKHLDAAKKGHCGFKFEHSQPCTGHHPPIRTNNFERLPDSDCARLTYQLRNWEHAQLQAYISQINQLVADRHKRSQNRWSAEALMRSNRNSITSFRSFAVSVNTYASAPCDTGANGEMDLSGLQKRLKNMSIREVGSSVKNTIMGRSGASTTSTKPSAMHDKALQTAIHRGELKKANELLTSGADPSQLHRASGNVTAAALWNHTEVQSLTVAHRLTEDIQGSCNVCHLNSAMFSKGSNKVKALLAHGADVNQTGGICQYPINSAAWMCKGDIVSMLLQNRGESGAAYVNQRDATFGSPLGIAASQAGYPGSEEVVSVLLAANANPFISGREGSPLEIVRRRLAFWEKSPEVMQISPDVVEERIESCESIIKLLEGGLERFENESRSEQIARFQRSGNM